MGAPYDVSLASAVANPGWWFSASGTLAAVAAAAHRSTNARLFIVDKTKSKDMLCKIESVFSPRSRSSDCRPPRPEGSGIYSF